MKNAKLYVFPVIIDNLNVYFMFETYVFTFFNTIISFVFKLLLMNVYIIFNMCNNIKNLIIKDE